MQDYQAFGASSLIRGKETGCFAAAAGQPRLSHPGKHRPFPIPQAAARRVLADVDTGLTRALKKICTIRRFSP